MNTGFRTLSIPFRSIHRLIQSVLPQLRFSFYRHQLLCADFSGGQITSDAGLLPLRSFDQRHRLTSDWAARLSDPRQDDRQRGQILLDLDSTDDPTHGQQQLSFFNGAYGQHMYHPMLVFERHTGCLLAARLRPGNASSHARIVPMLLRLLPRLQSAFPGVKIKLRGDAGFALPLLYQFCEFFAIEYALGIPAHCVFQRRAQPRQKQLQRRYRRTQLPQRSFSSFRHRARSWPRQRRICYKAEHTATGTNLRFRITNCHGRASRVFAFYNDRGECENRIEELKNGFRADRLSCHRFLANAFRLLLHAAAYNLVNFFRLQLPLPGAPHKLKPCALNSSKSAPAFATPPAVFAFTSPPAGRFRTCSAMSPSPSTVVDPFSCFPTQLPLADPAEPCSKSSPSGCDVELSLPNLMTWPILPFLNA